MGYAFIKAQTRGRVTTITLNRPDVMNAIHGPMHQELEAAFDAFAGDETQYVCVVTGAGDRAFCAGSDLRASAAGEGFGAYPKHGYAGIAERYDLYKPVIAAVNGICFGGGFEIALACDIIIAAEEARFSLPEPHVGAIAVGGGLHRLARQIGLKRAMGYVLTGARFDADQAFALGLVSEVVSQDQLASATDRWCAQIIAGAPIAVRASKEVMLRGLNEPSVEAAIKRQSSYPGYKAWRDAEDTREGPRAFAEKRAPVWRDQ